MSSVFDLSNTPIDDGITVVEASAGTGKTYCLTGLVLRLLLEERVSDVGKVLVVTFTNAATHELVSRLRAALRRAHGLLRGDASGGDAFFRRLAERHGDDRGRAILRRALLAFDELGVMTIHGFCKRVLEESAFESGVDFQPELLDDDEPLLLAAGRDFWRRRLYPAGDLVAAVVTEERWTPESFLGDYRVWRRHPETVVLPAARPLPEALDELREVVSQLGQVWNRSAMRTFLASLTFLKNAAVDASRTAALVEDLDAFLAGRYAVGLYAAKLLAAGALGRAARKAHREMIGNHPICRACGAIESAIRGLEHSLRQAFLTEVDGLFDRAKRATGTLAFDDLLRQLHAALGDRRRGPALAAAVRGRYQAVLVDEFQDTDLIQYDILHRLFGRGPLYLIGDPKQAIYRFRGADVFAYLEARSDAGRRYTLDRNWRADEGLLEAINAVFSRASRAFVFDQIPFTAAAAADQTATDDGGARRETLGGDGRPPLQWMWLPKQPNKELAGERIRQAVTAEIVDLLGRGLRLRRPGRHREADRERDLRPSDVAVLVRTNEQAERLQQTLRAARVPAVVSRAGDVFDSEEMEELQRLLAAVANPASATLARAAWTTRLWGGSGAGLLALDEDDEAWQERLEELEDARRAWLGQGFMAMIRRLIHRRGVRRRWLAGEAGERRLTNLLHAVEVLHQAILERHLSPAGLVAWLEAERAAGRSHDSDATELRLESDERAVQIVTVHKSKGLEFGIVFCPYLWEAVPQDRPPRPGAPVIAHDGPRRMICDYGSDRLDEHRARAEAERLAEDLRLAYVAMTRARHRCYVVWGDVGRSSAASALGYLLRAPESPHPDPLPQGERAPPPSPKAALRQRSAERSGLASDGSGRRAGVRSPLPLRERVRVRDPADHVKQALGGVKDAAGAWYLDLRGFVDRHPELMAIEALGDETPDVWSGAATPTRALEPPPGVYLRQRLETWRIASFSSLSRGGEAEAPDYLDPPAGRKAGGAPALPARSVSGMSAFARGTRAGTCLHEILEDVDFTAIGDEAARQAVSRALSRHGLDETRRHDPDAVAGWRPEAAVTDMLHRLCAAKMPLHGADLSLDQVGLGQRLTEWRFYLPLSRVAPRRLATIFRDHGQDEAGGDYARRLESLSSRTVHGFLTGFVDLIFTDGQRWYVADWKSNHLGDNLDDYGQESLRQAMFHHHYTLQYHLYVLALHRFLRYRLPDYDYERHVGGAVYVFLRGVDAAATAGGMDSGAGWFVDRPSPDLIDALEGILDR